MVEVRDYSNQVSTAWCPGCGDFAILNAVKRALPKAGLKPHQVLLVSGIGQASKLPDYVRANALTTLHGRPIPIAQGAHLANHELKVIVHAGDGDTYGIGGNHFIHLMRRNADVTLIVHNNRVYGLTKGQYSPTSPEGFVTKTSPAPAGAIDRPVNPIALALTMGATFIARAWSGDLQHLSEMIVAAVQHEGSALLDVLQPCVVFNKRYAYDYYRDRVYKLGAEEPYDPSDFDAAWKKAHERWDRFAIGVIYRAEGVPTYEEQVPTLDAGPLVKQAFREWSEEDYESLESEFT